MRERDRGLASLATDQHGVVSIRQLEQRLGFSHQAVGSVRGKLAPEKGTRPGVRGVAEGSRERHGSATDP
jgi:hypothetical protein